MRPVDVIRYMDDNGVLDVRGLSPDLVDRDLSKHVEKQLVTSLADLPRVRKFYGRERELDHIVSLLDARATTLLVPGIAGIGKTTVAGKLVERFTHRRNILYHRCQDWESARACLESVAEWLANMGDASFSDYLAATPVPQPSDAARLIADALSGTPSLLIMDDYHKVSDAVLHQTVQALALNLIEAEDLVGLVLFSRSFKPVVAAKDAEGRISSFVLPLDGLDPEATRKLLSSFEDLSDEQWLHIHGLSRGHPLVLELINRGASAGAYHESLEAYVSVEIFSKLARRKSAFSPPCPCLGNPCRLTPSVSRTLISTCLTLWSIRAWLGRRTATRLTCTISSVNSFCEASTSSSVRTFTVAASRGTPSTTPQPNNLWSTFTTSSRAMKSRMRSTC